VLLVTLIVTLPVMTHAVNLDLPQSSPLSNNPPPVIIDLEIDRDGTVAWNGAALPSWQQLESCLHTEAQRNPQPEIHLRPDRSAKYDSVAKVLAQHSATAWKKSAS